MKKIRTKRGKNFNNHFPDAEAYRNQVGLPDSSIDENQEERKEPMTDDETKKIIEEMDIKTDLDLISEVKNNGFDSVFSTCMKRDLPLLEMIRNMNEDELDVYTNQLIKKLIPIQ